ncbi:Hypothetical predicted protein [Mytilus galloprovincialis]|uniref:Uncharacterized protein n=1 Tax=Mytilus galloprovincialis TaxID=29158 RepID=A0A8B6BGT4_MYTGA|nr:Hypothetical predicted protein [Mytilus galloprovincialis]
MKENRRVGEIANLRREQRNLTKCLKKAELHQQKALKKLRDFNRERIQTMRRAEKLRKNRRERERKRSQFTAYSFAFVKKLIGEPKLHEVMSTLKKTRAASAPGPNGIPYRVYKNCPNLAKQLYGNLSKLYGEDIGYQMNG